MSVMIKASLLFAAMVGVMLALPSSAQRVVRFGGKSSFGSVQDCRGDRCVGVDVHQGISNGTTIALLIYEVDWFIDPVRYSLSGFGEIPVSDVQFTASTAVSLNVDTSTVPGFTGQLCFFNISTGENGCSQQLPIVTTDLHSNRLTTFRISGSGTSNYMSSIIHEAGTASSTSATGTASIADQ